MELGPMDAGPARCDPECAPSVSGRREQDERRKPSGGWGRGFRVNAARAAGAFALLFAGGASAQNVTVPTLGNYSAVGLKTYTIYWAQVAATPGSPATKATVALGNCMCDVTLNLCDPNCCCDSDCTSVEIQKLFTPLRSGWICLPEGPPAPKLMYCVSRGSVADYTLPASYAVVQVEQGLAPGDFISQNLCIAGSNNPELGRFFADPGSIDPTRDAALLASLTAAPVWSQPVSTPVPKLPDPSSLVISTGYHVNSSIEAVFAPSPGVSASLSNTPVPGGLFALPTTNGISGACAGLSVVGYMSRQPGYGAAEGAQRKCGRSVTSVAAACADPAFSGYSLINLLGLAKTPGSPIFQRVQVWVASYLDPQTGLTTPLPQFNTTSVGGSPTAVPAPQLRGNGACDFVLKSVDFLILNNAGNGDIAYVLANVTFATIPAGFTGTFQQGFSVDFVPAETGGLPQPAPGVRPKSGEDGYVYGQPILAGFPDSTTNPRAVLRLRDGLPTLSADDAGRCGPNALGRVSFGYSQDSSCAIPLTLAGLQSFCNGNSSAPTFSGWLAAVAAGNPGAAPPGPSPGTAPPLPVQLLGGFLYPASLAGTGDFGPYAGLPVYVAKWADADQSNVNNWRTDPATGQVKPLSAPPAMRLTSTSSKTVCSGVVTGVNYTIVTAFVGGAANPQNVISYVKAELIREDWTWFDMGRPTATQQFMLRTRVHFVSQPQQGARGVKPPMPPVFPSLPEDIFYPFLVDSAAADRLRGGFGGFGRAAAAAVSAAAALAVLAAL